MKENEAGIASAMNIQVAIRDSCLAEVGATINSKASQSFRGLSGGASLLNISGMQSFFDENGDPNRTAGLRWWNENRYGVLDFFSSIVKSPLKEDSNREKEVNTTDLLREFLEKEHFGISPSSILTLIALEVAEGLILDDKEKNNHNYSPSKLHKEVAEAHILSDNQKVVPGLSRIFLASAIRDIMEDMDVSTRDLKKRSGIALSTINAARAGTTSIDKALEVLAALGYTVSCSVVKTNTNSDSSLDM